MFSKRPGGSLWTASLLIAGTTIGGGALALPIYVCFAGFIPGLVISIACWAVMLSTALLFLEIHLNLPGEPNIISMAGATLGRGGKGVAWVVYLFLFYCLMVAYIDGGGSLFYDLFGSFVPKWLTVVLFAVFIAPWIFFGTHCVKRFNAFFALGLLVSFLLFFLWGWNDVKGELLIQRQWPATLYAVPIMFTSFAFQGTIPSLVTYMQRDARRIRWALIIGSTIPLVIYVIWQWLILGIVPLEGEGGLAETFFLGRSAVYPFKNTIHHPWIYPVSAVFAFCALVTSLLGVSLGLFDFLADGLPIPKGRRGRLALLALVFGIPLLVVELNPSLFYTALNYAGGFGVALLLGILPILMAWSLRSRQQSLSYRLPGGKPLLLFLLFLIVSAVVIEVAQECGLLRLPASAEVLGSGVDALNP